MEAKKGDIAKVHYTGKLDDGTVFDSSSERDPLEFTIGSGEVIPGFDQAVTGLTAGQSTTAKITADQAYGPHRDEMIIEINRRDMPEGMNPSVDDQLQLTNPEGQTVVATVTEAGDEAIKVDANHPLAGKDLTFEITLVAVA